MARKVTANTDLVNKVKIARGVYRLAIAEAEKKFHELVHEATAEAREQMYEAIRDAVANGVSTRQIGFAYGSSDFNTAKRIVAEATAGMVDEVSHETRQWLIDSVDGNRFTISVYNIDGRNGSATCEIDEDGVNFTAIDGDLWIAIQLYRLGFKDDIIKEVNGE